MYLRQFRELKTICVKGNPITQKADFMPFILAHLPQIVYLDYKRVDQNIVRFLFLFKKYIKFVINDQKNSRGTKD